MTMRRALIRAAIWISLYPQTDEKARRDHIAYLLMTKGG